MCIFVKKQQPPKTWNKNDCLHSKPRSKHVSFSDFIIIAFPVFSCAYFSGALLCCVLVIVFCFRYLNVNWLRINTCHLMHSFLFWSQHTSRQKTGAVSAADWCFTRGNLQTRIRWDLETKYCDFSFHVVYLRVAPPPCFFSASFFSHSSAATLKIWKVLFVAVSVNIHIIKDNFSASVPVEEFVEADILFVMLG